MQYQIFAALRDDAHQGWVWLQDASLPARCVVKITNQANGRSIYCEALQFEQNFLTAYNKPPRFTIKDTGSSLVIGAWFRAGLGDLKTESEVSLSIKRCSSSWGQFKACTHHPQIVVRLAIWLGGIGLVLGLFGLALGVWSQVASGC